MKSVIAFSNQYTRRIKKGSMGPVQYFYFSKLSDISSCRYTFDSPQVSGFYSFAFPQPFPCYFSPYIINRGLYENTSCQYFFQVSLFLQTSRNLISECYSWRYGMLIFMACYQYAPPPHVLRIIRSQKWKLEYPINIYPQRKIKGLLA